MIYKGNEPSNHKGSIVKWPRLKYPENQLDEYIYKNKERNSVREWREDVLLEPVCGQIIVSLKYGLSVLSAGEYPLVEVTHADLWNKECELRLEQLKEKYRNNEKHRSNTPGMGD